MRVKKPLLPAFLLALLVAAGVLLVGGAEGQADRATVPATCQPVEALALHNPDAPVHPRTEVDFRAEVLTGSLPVTYTWVFGDGTQSSATVALTPALTATHSYTETGRFSVTLTAWNTCTLPPLAATLPVTVTAQPCLTLTGLALTHTPTHPYTYTEVLFGGEVVAGSLPVTYSWTFGDGTQPLTGTAASPRFTATHTFTAAQVYTVGLAAWNACTLTPTQQAITLSIAPCQAVSGLTISPWPTAARAGEVLTFTAGVTGGSPPRAFAWAFGDGETAGGQVVTHTYAAQPTVVTYTLILTASNPCSQRLTTTTLQVAPPLPRRFLPLVARDFPHQAAHLGYGANIASADHAISLTVMGFDWAKGFVTWSQVGPGPNYNWVAVDNQLAEFVPRVRHVLLRLGGPPPAGVGNPPASASDRAAFHDFALALAAHVSDTWRVQGLETIAYEIWNEPNLDYEWGGSPSAAQYTALLQAGYAGIKTADPQAWVVSAGLATTGGSAAGDPVEQAETLALARRLYGAIEVVPDLTFLRNMYNHGAKGYFDALGSHPYGGPDAPDTPPGTASGPIYFRRAEEQRQVMLDYGDPSPVWATEFGWILESECHLGEHEWMEVGETQQADYLAAAYAYADEHWPWMGPMFLFNLDFATCTWYDWCDPMRWYAITYRQDPYDPGNSPVLPRQAFHTLRAMPKHSAW